MKHLLPIFILIIAITLFFVFIQKQPPLSPLHHIASQPSLYPNASLTPGATFSTVTSSQICTKGYTTTVRNVSTETKRLVYQEYNVSYPQPKGAYEVDHFIPLELGGSNDIKNLWLEAASPPPGFHEKDVVENYLHAQVCNGSLSLQTAQQEITADWYKVYTQIQNPAAYKY